MQQPISSSANPQVKLIRKLRDRKARQQSGLFYVEGLKLVGDALEKGARLQTLIVCQELLVSDFGQTLLQHAQGRNISILNVTRSVFASFALKEGPQGIAALAEQAWQGLEQAGAQKGLWAALDEVQDPGNLGAVLRSLDAAGGQGLIVLDESTDAYHPTAVRASMGAIFSQKLVKTNSLALRDWKRTSGAHVVGTWCGEALPYRDYNYPEDVILLMGSEQKGLSQELAAMCDQLVHIPMRGSVDSLNLACAASIVLFEISNQRESRKGR